MRIVRVCIGSSWTGAAGWADRTGSALIEWGWQIFDGWRKIHAKLLKAKACLPGYAGKIDQLKLLEAAVKGVFVVDSEENRDERGSFFRTFCAGEFEQSGLPTRFVQSSISRNSSAGTLRGMHFQKAPRAEGKLVRCIHGRIFDVALDLRGSSPTFRRWFAIELDGAGTQAVFIPAGVAHGFQTLEDNTQIAYQMTEPYVPELAGGVRWDDPAFSISWPRAVSAMSDRDRNFADFDENLI